MTKLKGELQRDLDRTFKSNEMVNLGRHLRVPGRKVQTEIVKGRYIGTYSENRKDSE